MQYSTAWYKVPIIIKVLHLLNIFVLVKKRYSTVGRCITWAKECNEKVIAMNSKI